MIYAYLRVSTDDQDTANQRIIQSSLPVYCYHVVPLVFFNTTMPTKKIIASEIDIVFIAFIPT